jgi:hypothetical protein
LRRKADARLEAAKTLAERQDGQAFAVDAVQQGAADQGGIGGDLALFKDELADAGQTAGGDAAARVGVEAVLGRDEVREVAGEGCGVERGGEQDAVAGLAGAEFADGEPGLAGERIGRVEVGAAAAGEAVLAGLAAGAGDRARGRRRRGGARRHVIPSPRAGEGLGWGAGGEIASPCDDPHPRPLPLRGRELVVGRLRPAARQRAGVFGAAGAVAGEALQTVCQVGVGSAEAAFAQHCGDQGGAAGGAALGAVDDHVGEARRERQTG